MCTVPTALPLSPWWDPLQCPQQLPHQAASGIISFSPDRSDHIIHEWCLTTTIYFSRIKITASTPQKKPDLVSSIPGRIVSPGAANSGRTSGADQPSIFTRPPFLRRRCFPSLARLSARCNATQIPGQSVKLPVLRAWSPPTLRFVPSVASSKQFSTSPEKKEREKKTNDVLVLASHCTC
jgi:hypothetical protein